jgi:hypothetical protein
VLVILISTVSLHSCWNTQSCCLGFHSVLLGLSQCWSGPHCTQRQVTALDCIFVGTYKHLCSLLLLVSIVTGFSHPATWLLHKLQFSTFVITSFNWEISQLAKQAFYHLSHTSSLFCSGYLFIFCGTGAWTQGLHLEPFHQPFFLWWVGFQDRILRTVFLGWLWTEILLIFASWIAKIIGISNWCPAAPVIFGDGVWWTIFSDWPWTLIFSISASQVALPYRCEPLVPSFFFVLFFFFEMMNLLGGYR